MLRVSFTLYGEREILSTYPCVSFRFIRNTGAKRPVSAHDAAIYAAYKGSQPPDDRTYSAEVTGLRRNLPLHRRRSAGRTRRNASLFIVLDCLSVVKSVFAFFTKIFSKLWLLHQKTRRLPNQPSADPAAPAHPPQSRPRPIFALSPISPPTPASHVLSYKGSLPPNAQRSKTQRPRPPSRS